MHHDDRVYCIRVCARQNLFLSLSADGSVAVWSSVTHQVLSSFGGFYRYDYDRDLDVCFDSNTIYGTQRLLRNVRVVRIRDRRSSILTGRDPSSVYSLARVSALSKVVCTQQNKVALFNGFSKKLQATFGFQGMPKSLLYSKKNRCVFVLVTNTVSVLLLEPEPRVVQTAEMLPSHSTMRLVENERKLVCGGLSKMLTWFEIRAE